MGIDFEQIVHVGDEYYVALGSETVKSKFFHLFAIIEFAEHNYKQYQETENMFDQTELEQLKQALDEVWKANKCSFSKAQKQTIDLRNKTFHGEEDELREYKKVVEFLLYLCEAIIQSPKISL